MISKSALDSYSSEFLSLVLLLMGTRSWSTHAQISVFCHFQIIRIQIDK
jgi:hypothetical protein